MQAVSSCWESRFTLTYRAMRSALWSTRNPVLSVGKVGFGAAPRVDEPGGAVDTADVTGRRPTRTDRYQRLSVANGAENPSPPGILCAPCPANPTRPLLPILDRLDGPRRFAIPSARHASCQSSPALWGHSHRRTGATHDQSGRADFCLGSEDAGVCAWLSV